MADRFRQRHRHVGVGSDIVPMMNFDSTKHHDAIELVLKPVSLGSAEFEQLTIGESELTRRDIALIRRKIGCH
jgi:hypothetical protein